MSQQGGPCHAELPVTHARQGLHSLHSASSPDVMRPAAAELMCTSSSAFTCQPGTSP